MDGEENSIKLELLKQSYWEHYKKAKDLAMVHPLRHPERVRVEAEVNRIQGEITEELENIKKQNKKHEHAEEKAHA